MGDVPAEFVKFDLVLLPDVGLLPLLTVVGGETRSESKTFAAPIDVSFPANCDCLFLGEADLDFALLAFRLLGKFCVALELCTTLLPLSFIGLKKIQI